MPGITFPVATDPDHAPWPDLVAAPPGRRSRSRWWVVAPTTLCLLAMSGSAGPALLGTKIASTAGSSASASDPATSPDDVNAGDTAGSADPEALPPGASQPVAPAPVLAALSEAAAAPTAAGVSHALDSLLSSGALGDGVTAEVIDVRSGVSLYARNATRPAVAASGVKLLTSAAALSVLGTDAALVTRTVSGARPDQVFLVGGGDVMLDPGRGHPDAVQGHAGLGDLARLTATALRAQGVSKVTLALDDTLFAGSPISSSWRHGDVTGGFVAPVMALEMTVGVTRPGHPPKPGQPAARLTDPAMAAAQQFARQLGSAGIAVQAAVSRAKAPQAAPLLGQVRSATIGDLVEHDLTDSDNTSAEAMARMVAAATNRPVTFAGGGAAVLTALQALGVPTAGARLPGGSGLGKATVVSAQTLASVLALAASPAHPQLRPLLTGLPVAGASGTLEDRFAGSAQQGALGVVRAKTGTLTGASSLAGTVVDADGRMLAFAVLAPAVTSTLSARKALDAVAAALAACGCR